MSDQSEPHLYEDSTRRQPINCWRSCAGPGVRSARFWWSGTIRGFSNAGGLEAW